MKKILKSVTVLLLYVLFTITVLCPDNVSAAEETKLKVAVGNVSAGSSKLTLVRGKKAQLTVKYGTKKRGKYSYKTVKTDIPTYKTNDKSVVSVSKKGIVKAENPGKAVITVIYKNLSVKIKITVKQQTLRILADDKAVNFRKTQFLETGRTLVLQPQIGTRTSLKADYAYRNFSAGKIKWESSNPAVLTVSKSGKITAGKTGMAKITAKYDGMKRVIIVEVTETSVSGENNKIDSEEEREELLYKIIEEGCRNKTGIHFDASLNIVKSGDYIDISDLGYSNRSEEDKETVYRTYRRVFYDHSEFFYLEGGMYRYGPNGPLLGIIPMYQDFAEKEADVDRCEKEMEKSVALAMERVSGISDPIEQLLVLYDYIAENTVYNWDVAVNRKDSAADYAWSAYGQLVKHDAVCKGVALSYKLLVDRLNNPRIKCIVISSADMDHVWNMVTIDDKDSYHIDVNRSINNVPTLRGRAAHTGFLLSDETVREMGYRKWEESTPYDSIPACSSKKYESGYVFNNMDFPVYRKNGTFYYLKKTEYGKYSLCCGALSEDGKLLADISVLSRGFRTDSGVVWRGDFLYYVDDNLRMIEHNILTDRSRILGNINFEYRPSPDGYYSEQYDGVGLYFDEISGKVVAVSRTRREELGRF